MSELLLRWHGVSIDEDRDAGEQRCLFLSSEMEPFQFFIPKLPSELGVFVVEVAGPTATVARRWLGFALARGLSYGICIHRQPEDEML